MLEPNIYALWVGKQTAKGTPNATPAKRLVWVGGDFGLSRDDGEERFSDLTKYGARADWVNSLTGQGEPAVEGTPTEFAYLLWLFHGAETVTAVPGPPAASKHSFKPVSGRGHWHTYARRVGQTVLQRTRFADCLITRVQIEGSTQNKAVRITPRVLSLDPGEVLAADPAAAMPTDKTFVYTDAAAMFEIDGIVIRGQSQYTLVIDEDLSATYGDDVVPHDLVQGSAVVTIGVTLKMDADALARWNAHVYGNPAPAATAKPVRSIPALGSYAFSHIQKGSDGATPNGRQFDLDLPGVKWDIPDMPPANAAGGDAEIALAGSMRPVVGQDPYTLDVYTDAAAVAFTT